MILKEMAYPSSWSMQDFGNLKNKTARLEYAKKHLTPIGRGSSRNVYRIDDDKVLKIANKAGFENKGTAQNEQEISLSTDTYFNHLFAPIYDYDEKNSFWLEMAYAKPITKNEFKKIIGVGFDLFMENLKKQYKNINTNKKHEKIEDYFFEIQFFNDLLELFMNYDFGNINDFYSLNHYGLFNGDVVLIDYGVDMGILKKFYGYK